MNHYAAQRHPRSVAQWLNQTPFQPVKGPSCPTA
jgi:hypothetical protein